MDTNSTLHNFLGVQSLYYLWSVDPLKSLSPDENTNNLQICLWNLNSSLHTKLQLPSFTNKKVRKTAHCALSTAHCAPSAHLNLQKHMIGIIRNNIWHKQIKFESFWTFLTISTLSTCLESRFWVLKSRIEHCTYPYTHPQDHSNTVEPKTGQKSRD